ncbi:MAG: ABC transporter permease [Candidatus Bathyarchaeia archaeon]
MLIEELRGVYYILLKDLRAYYFKPPNISWGILFPLTLALAFSLRNPVGLAELAPGLIAMAAVFGTTSMEAIVITFERRTGALERLLLAPISLKAILMGKVLGGTVFGLMISGVMTVISMTFFQMRVLNPPLFSVSLLLTLMALSSLGAFVAVSVKEVFEAQTLSNYFRFPMIFLCGVFIPIEAMPPPLRAVAYFLPLTYSVDALREVTLGVSALGSLLDVIALSLFLTAFLAIANGLLKRSLR